MSRRAPQRGRQRSTPKRAALGPPFELDIDGLSHDGRGIGKHQGKTVFVSGALPGERALVKLQRESSRYSEGQVLQLLNASEQRQTPVCVHFGQCGGCQLQHLSAADQLLAKQQGVLDQLRRFAGLVPAQLEPALTANELGYRARARLGVQFNKVAEVTLGFRRAGDKQLVSLRQCPVLQPSLQATLAPLTQWLGHYKVLAVSHIELVATAHCTLVFRLTRALPSAARDALAELAKRQQWQVFLQSSSDKKALTDLTDQPVDPRLSYPLTLAGQKPLSIAFHPTDFTQVNPELNQKMVAQVIDWLALTGQECLWDLFCGVGNFSLPAAQRAKRVVAIEAVTAMVARGRENAAANGLVNIDFIAADLSQSSIDKLMQTAGRPDAVLLDPPRDGAREVCQQLGKLKRTRILYVSCNPATFARDARILVDQGYRLERFAVMEMFAQTSHLETMALFIKA